MKLFSLSLILFLTACSEPYPYQYKSAGEFEADLASWGITGINQKLSAELLTKKNFKCKDNVCLREIPGAVCLQKQRVQLITNTSGIVTHLQIWRVDNGQLPTACL